MLKGVVGDQEARRREDRGVINMSLPALRAADQGIDLKRMMQRLVGCRGKTDPPVGSRKFGGSMLARNRRDLNVA